MCPWVQFWSICKHIFYRFVQVIVGGVLDEGYYKTTFLKQLTRCSNTYYFGALPQVVISFIHMIGCSLDFVNDTCSSMNFSVVWNGFSVCFFNYSCFDHIELTPSLFVQHVVHALVEYSFAVVNTSHSEGLPNCLLEAMMIGTPVIARRVPGNASIVHEGETGMLFDSAEECMEHLSILSEYDNIRNHITDAAIEFVDQRYSFSAERASYQALVTPYLKIQLM